MGCFGATVVCSKAYFGTVVCAVEWSVCGKPILKFVCSRPFLCFAVFSVSLLLRGWCTWSDCLSEICLIV